jgi:ATP-dependent helicase Lhr and Lhr-like helicase
MAGIQVLEKWFESQGWTPFEFQREAWNAYLNGQSGLIHAATGMGKTYAAWLGAIAEFLDESSVGKSYRGDIPLRVLWITPLRALAADTEEALRAPLIDLDIPWILESRTGDTSSKVRAKQRQRLPTTLITTPESLSLLLTRADADDLFRDLRAVIVDEWHELLASKRGVQTELALARLRRMKSDQNQRPTLRTWGLSATLGNLDIARDTLLGMGNPGVLIRGLTPKPIRVKSLIPETIERFPWAGHIGTRMLPQVIDVVEQGQSALVFTNTRSFTEIWYNEMLDLRPDWSGEIALHHGSLDPGVRAWVEGGLREGRLRCVISTSSLDLGVDFSPVDNVVQVGSPKSVARLIQRAGRSGHRPGAESRIYCAPTHAFELVEVAGIRRAIEDGLIESREPYRCPLDVLVQHLVTIALGGGFTPDDLLAEVRTTNAYRDLTDEEWAWSLDFVTRGGDALRAYPEYHRVTVEESGRYVVTDQMVAKRHRLSIGTIVSDAQITVQFLKGAKLGTVEESFISRLRPGDKFTFAGRTVEFVMVRDMKAWVRKAKDSRGAIPRWMGGRLPLSSQLADSVRRVLDEARRGIFDGDEMEAVRPLLELQSRWSAIPAFDELLIERVETGEGHHLFVYPFEGRLVHEGLAALCAYRLSRITPITFTLAQNDYGFELLSPDPAPLDDALSTLFSPEHLDHDIPASLNATEMARRQFREIARVAGLIFTGYPGAQKTTKQVQVSSSLLFDVFDKYDPSNKLIEQARREVLERQLERSRLETALHRIAAGRITVLDIKRPTPFAFPLLVDRLRESVSSERLSDRILRMQIRLEKAADTGSARRR